MGLFRSRKQAEETNPLITFRPNKTNVFPYIIATLLSCQIALIAGVFQGYSAILLAQLKVTGSSLRINEDQASWIVSLENIFRPIGVLIEGSLNDKFGRKTLLLVVSQLFFIGWILTYFSNTIFMLYVSRSFLSFVLGMVVCVSLYIAEISRPEERDIFMTFALLFITLGELIVYTLGYVLNWKTIAMILFIYSEFIFFLLFLIPESFIWYMIKKRKPEAIAALLWFRRSTVITNVEIREMEKKLEKIDERTKFLDNFFDPAVWKPLLIMIGFSVFQQQVGYNIIVFYAVDFFTSLGSTYDGIILSMIFAALSVVSNLLLIVLINKYNKKILMIVSGLGMTVSMVIGAICLSIPNISRTIAVFSVFSYVLFSMGMLSIPIMIISEIFPSKIRGNMSAIVLAILYLMTFLNLKFYPFLNNWLKVNGLFWYFAVFSLITVIFVLLFFPKTKNRSLFDIEEEFRTNIKN